MSEPSSEDAAYNWAPSPHAIFFETFPSANETRRPTIIVSHPTAPFVRRLADGEDWSEKLMAQVAHAYLVRLNARLTELGHHGGLGLPAGWLEALDPSGPDGYFGWLPIRPSFDKNRSLDPSGAVASHLLQRRRGDGSSSYDKTVILVAGERWLDDKDWRSTRSDFGLRIVLHLRDRDGRQEINVGAMTAHLPYAHYAMLFELLKDPAVRVELDDLLEPLNREKLQRFSQRAAVDIAGAAHLRADQDDGLVLDEFRFIRVDNTAERGKTVRIEVGGVGVGLLASDQARTSYRFRARLWPKEPFETEIVSRRALVANVAPADDVRVRIFEQDPACWRDSESPTGAASENLWLATRPTRDLDCFRTRRVVPEVLKSDYDDFCVRNCPDIVRTDPDDPGPRRVCARPGGHPVRSEDQSAVGAYHNCDDVFAVMRGFGLCPELYFRACQRPLEVFYRSGISPGPGKSGRTINAQVKRQKPCTSGFMPDERSVIELRLALANLTHWRRDLARPVEERWAEPLGIAASERWMLHEFGHVLIAATLGDLEFRFAHSPGDGFAAVWADPPSRLADPRLAPERMRGHTFPWVFLRRRHDRCVLNGWSWSGTFQRPVTETPEIDLERFKGYLSEQILSTTLFRLYRCLGGDTFKHDGTTPDIERRLAASRVVLYLVMRALESFGHVPLRAEELEAAMIDADLGLTTPLTLHREPPMIGADLGFTTLLTPDPHTWVGGRAHKVIRWAFEAQGMHPPRRESIHDNVGAPPRVDIYIKDRRLAEEMTESGVVSHKPGGYPPVSFHWGAAWFADDAPQVGNRGDEPATYIKGRRWCGELDGESIRWIREHSFTEEPVPGGPPRPLALDDQLRSELESSSGSGVVLVELSCPDDRASTDPLAGLPTAVAAMSDLPRNRRELANLVATDNNLGLWCRRC